VIFLVVLLLILGGVGGYLYHRHHKAAGRPATASAKQVAADTSLGGRVGIQAADLTGWTTTRGAPGDAFTPALASTPAATAAGTKALSSLAGCLKVPVSEVSRTFNGSSPARASVSSSPTYNDPTSPGTTASSVVAIMRGPSAEHADEKLFSDPTTFANCYAAYATALLPYQATTTAAAAPYTTVQVQSEPEATATSTRVHIQAFEITRTGKSGSLITIAVAVFGGRMQAELNLSSPTVFPAPIQLALVNAVEGRITGNLPAEK
jgi:hypothetical protein